MERYAGPIPRFIGRPQLYGICRIARADTNEAVGADPAVQEYWRAVDPRHLALCGSERFLHHKVNHGLPPASGVHDAVSVLSAMHRVEVSPACCRSH